MENESEPEIQIEYYELHETDQLSDILSNNDSRSSVYRYYCKCLYFLFFFFSYYIFTIFRIFTIRDNGRMFFAF